ncbi:MAG: hypothetical protein UW97_C0004G0010 [Parcubacteria group bacterium GW2011_GWA2_45_15]|nr:MAG: hypothetical protein UW97_C0004G0010 [Parcubacteria group bacterium GW2011_GWA2_45_15]
MFKREKVLVPATSGQVGEVAGALIGEMNFSKEEARAIIGNMGVFRKSARQFYAQFRINSVPDFSSDLTRWEGNYGKLFGLKQKPDLSAVRIPEKPEGIGPMRLIVVVLMDWMEERPFFHTQKALEEHFPCWQYTGDLDKEFTINDRHPKNGSYAVWVKDVQEAGEEFANKSVDDLVAEQYTGITVLERQLLEADVFFQKGEHLDRQNVTLCSGSRSRDGCVPSAFWLDRFRVRWCGASGRDPHLRSRRVWA